MTVAVLVPFLRQICLDLLRKGFLFQKSDRYYFKVRKKRPKHATNPLEIYDFWNIIKCFRLPRQYNRNKFQFFPLPISNGGGIYFEELVLSRNKSVYSHEKSKPLQEALDVLDPKKETKPAKCNCSNSIITSLSITKVSFALCESSL